MNPKTVPVTVHILEKEYRVACAEGESEALLLSARYLSSKMKEIRDRGKVVGVERIAVIAALNLAHELLQHGSREEAYTHSVVSRVQILQSKIESALNKSNQMEI